MIDYRKVAQQALALAEEHHIPDQSAAMLTLSTSTLSHGPSTQSVVGVVVSLMHPKPASPATDYRPDAEDLIPSYVPR